MRRICWTLLIAILTLTAAVTVEALVVPDGSSPAAEKVFRHPDLAIRDALVPARQLPALAATQALADLGQLGAKAEESYLDGRGGTWGTLLPSTPLLPGGGPGNDLTWSDFGRSGPPADLRRDAWNAFEAYLALNQDALRIDVDELARPGRVSVHNGGELIQIFAPRVIHGVPVRDSYLVGTISQGNLILFGAHHWGPAAVPTEPRLTADDAAAVVDGHLGSLTSDGVWRRPYLVVVPTAPGNGFAAGKAYRYRLAWVISPRFAGDYGRYEGLVDAVDGTLLTFEDTNQYATTRQVKGGVYPESNDGIGAEGTEQAGWPMPFADLTTAACGNGVCEPSAGEDCVSCAADCRGVQGGNPNNRFCCGDGDGQNPVSCADARCNGAGFQCSATAGAPLFTDAGGNLLSCVDGTVTTHLAGQFMRMNDACGAINESSTGDIDLGTSGGIDCTVPPGHSAGDTHSSRSGFYEMNRIKEMARGQLPGNAWLEEQLLSNMNINLTCNAFWSGADVNFYRSGGGCNNTGELAGVFDHEWGHGMDDNDTNGVISNPGEGIADIYAALRLNKSCIGRGFLLGSACGGYGDPCIGSPPCDGVRDIDFAKRSSGNPHNITFIDAACGSGGSTPCGGSTHCEGAVYSEAVWDLFNRDLTGNFDTKLEIATRLTYLGAANVGNWYQCVQGSGGCPAGSGYMQYLAADDDDANLSNGTPHMTAIFAAFNRHGIACSTPTVQNSGCAGAPTTAPTISTATGIDRGALLAWGSVTGATKYQIFRTDGVFGCNFGKTKVGETAGTSFTDSGLQNGRNYFYTVIPVGSHDTCMGPSSACTTIVPVAGPNLGLGSGTVSITSGDGDPFLDNCETATVSFPVTNIGNATQTNVRIVSVSSSNPGVSVTSTLPKSVSASLATCASANGSFDILAGGLSSNETLTLTVGVTSDQLTTPNGVTKTRTYTVQFAESDFQNFASRNFNFESSTEGWTPIQGTFNRTSAGGGGNGTTWYEASSANLPDQCDQIRSPVVSLTSTSTMSLWNQFEIEGVFQGSTWYDRANIGLLDPATGSRTAVSPSGGRLYNASGANGTCGTTGQPGWASSNTTWGTSTWSAAALGSAANAGKILQLEVRYGTDALAQGFGFHFDEVTLTNVNVQVADTQSNTCPTCGDGMCTGTENQCSCPSDCGAPPLFETGLCTDLFDNDCDGPVDCADNDCSADPACQGGGAVCGDGICQSSSENCLTCPADCRGVQNGNPNNRFCCGNGGGQNPVTCADPRCTSGGFQCV